MSEPTIKLSETIHIYPPPPSSHHPHTLPLSHLDTDPILHVNFRYIRVYTTTTTTDADPFRVISTSLSAALAHYHPLVGSLRRRSPSDPRLELFYDPTKGVPMIRATANISLASVNHLDNPTGHFVEQLVPNAKMDDFLLNPFELQLTVFSCGGFTLGASVYHGLCDGLGMTQFFNLASEFARGAASMKVEPVWRRPELLGPRDPPRVVVPLSDFLSVGKGLLPYSESVGEVVRECFEVKDECLERFKGVLFDECGLRFTTFEALGSFIWRARVKASNFSDNENVKFAYSISIRKLINPPLPNGYWGNGNVPIYVQLSAKQLLNQPISETAKLINKSKSTANDEYVRSYIDFQELNLGNGITPGKGVSGFTDWRHLGHSTVDFGWGGPVTVFPLTSTILGSVEPTFFLPYSTAKEGKKDGFKVLLYLSKTSAPAIREAMKSFSGGEFVLP